MPANKIKKPSRQPHLVHIASSLDMFGVWEVTVLLGNKEYTYALSSEYGYNKFLNNYNKGLFGRALACLRHFMIKPYLDKKGNLSGQQNELLESNRGSDPGSSNNAAVLHTDVRS